MCGLWGVASSRNLYTKELDAVESLGRLSTPRGKDSTGAVSIRFTPKEENVKFRYTLRKDVCEPTYFFNRKCWKEVRQGTSQIIMGHNRHATIGNVNKKGAHPFDIRDDNGNFKLIGMHNGTLSNYVSEEEEKKETYVNDSHKLYTEIAEKGFKETLEGLKEHSAYALAFITLDCKPTFFRNSGRTLFLGITEDEKVIYWASERRFLECIEKYHDIKLKDIKPLPTNTLVRINLDGDKIKSTVKLDLLEDSIIKKHEKKKPYKYNNSNNSSHVFSSWWPDYNKGTNYNYSNKSPKIKRDNEFQSYYPKLTEEDMQASIEYKPALNHIQWSVKSANNVSRTQYIQTNNPRFEILFKEWKRREFLLMSMPILSNDEDNYDILVELPRKNGKQKIKRIPTHHDHWYGWNELYENQEMAFRRFCDCKIMGPLNKCMDVLHYNDMRRRAREISDTFHRENEKQSKNTKSNKKEEEVIEFLQEGDESKSPLFYRHTKEVPIKNMIEHFQNNFCAVCDQKQSINDRVFFTPGNDIICYKCESIDLVRSQYPSSSLVEGKVIRYV